VKFTKQECPKKSGYLIPSFNGRPVDTDSSTFFGAPSQSPNWIAIKAADAGFEHLFASGVQLRHQVQFAIYDKYYQNIFPGALNAAGDQVRILGYSSATKRNNLFSQTDLSWNAMTGSWRHQLTAGIELSRQTSDNFRTTGYFDELGKDIRSVMVPVASPVVSLKMTFRQSPTDIDNHSTARSSGIYLQDQVELDSRWRAIVGLRLERFDFSFLNNRTMVPAQSEDKPILPRAALVYKPAEETSVYVSYTESFGPRAGDQLASLTPENQSLGSSVSMVR